MARQAAPFGEGLPALPARKTLTSVDCDRRVFFSLHFLRKSIIVVFFFFVSIGFLFFFFAGFYRWSCGWMLRTGVSLQMILTIEADSAFVTGVGPMVDMDLEVTLHSATLAETLAAVQAGIYPLPIHPNYRRLNVFLDQFLGTRVSSFSVQLFVCCFKTTRFLA